MAATGRSKGIFRLLSNGFRAENGIMVIFSRRILSHRNLVAAIQLILEDRREDALRGLPKDAIQDTVAIP